MLESLHRPLRSADELVGEAGRFREPITDSAGKDDPLCGAQVDQVIDTGEDRIDAVLRAQHAADHLAVVDQRRHRPRVDPGSRCVPMSRLLAHQMGRSVEDGAEVAGNAEAPRNAH